MLCLSRAQYCLKARLRRALSQLRRAGPERCGCLWPFLLQPTRSGAILKTTSTSARRSFLWCVLISPICCVLPYIERIAERRREGNTLTNHDYLDMIFFGIRHLCTISKEITNVERSHPDAPNARRGDLAEGHTHQADLGCMHPEEGHNQQGYNRDRTFLHPPASWSRRPSARD